MELSTKSGPAPKNHALAGWTIMHPAELLRYMESGKGRPNNGLSAWHNGQRTADNGRDYAVYGVTRDGDGFHTVLTSAVMDVTGVAADVVGRLSVQAEVFGVPFDDFDPDIVHIGVSAEDYDPRDLNTPAKAIGIVVEMEDKMAAFIASARDLGLLDGVPLGVRNVNELKI